MSSTLDEASTTSAVPRTATARSQLRMSHESTYSSSGPMAPAVPEPPKGTPTPPESLAFPRASESPWCLPRPQLDPAWDLAWANPLSGAALPMACNPNMAGAAFGLLEKASKRGGQRARFFCVRDAMLLQYEASKDGKVRLIW